MFMKYKKNTIYSFSYFCISFFLVTSFFIFSYCNLKFINGCINFSSIIIWLTTFCLAVKFLFSFLHNGVSGYNTFFLIFSFFLHINTYKLSKLQIQTSIKDLYYIIFPIFLYGIILFLFEKIKFKQIQFNLFESYNITRLSRILFYIYIILSIFMIFRLKPSINYFANDKEYSIPILTGVLACLGLFMIFCTDYSLNKKIVFIIFFLVYGILSFHRGNVFRVLLFYITYWILESQKKQGIKIIRKLFTIMICSASLFIIYGNIRQQLRHGNEYDSSYYSKRYNVNIGSLFWIGDYTIINFDVLKLYYDYPSKYKMTYILSPMKRFVDKNFSTKRKNEIGVKYINGLDGMNAATFLNEYIVDLKEFFFIELIISALLMGFLLRYSKKNNFIILYAFLITQVILNFFSNNIFTPSIFYPVFLFVITSKLLKENLYVKKRIV